MSDWRWFLRRWRRAIGWPGLAGIALLVLAAVVYVGLSLPEHLQLAGVQQQVAAARARAASPANTQRQGAEAQVAAFYNAFPSRDTAPAWLQKIYAAGDQFSLSLDRAEYKQTLDRNSRLFNYEVNLPVKGSYVQIREFIRTVLTEIPTLALREVQIRRPNIAEPTVDAQIRFILYLREAA
ncbi:MAG: type 4a pilus biogenesis protein PilO [Actinomycetota bacterium]